MCCENTCTDGDCCDNADCSEGDCCYDNTCSECTAGGGALCGTITTAVLSLYGEYCGTTECDYSIQFAVTGTDFTEGNISAPGYVYSHRERSPEDINCGTDPDTCCDYSVCQNMFANYCYDLNVVIQGGAVAVYRFCVPDLWVAGDSYVRENYGEVHWFDNVYDRAFYYGQRDLTYTSTTSSCQRTNGLDDDDSTMWMQFLGFE